ncbi:MAG: hypothetical protein IPL33_20940 [Sphingobacteriales bacterium]|nr:hypothetical protein [Sphingobacteriales bacterium]
MSKTRRLGDRAGAGAGTHVVAGERAIAELLATVPARVRRLLVAPARAELAVVAQARAAGIAIELADPQRLARLADDGPAKGMVALADPPPVVALDELVAAALARPRPRLVALDGVVDPHNKGAILRSAEFFGVAGALWSKDGSAPLSPAAVRASAGATERLAMAEVGNLARALRDCRRRRPVDRRHGRRGRAAAGRGRTPWGPPEAPRARLRWRTRRHASADARACDFQVTIERSGAIASLNVRPRPRSSFAALR